MDISCTREHIQIITFDISHSEMALGSHSLSPHSTPPPLPHSVITHTVSVDVKHHLISHNEHIPLQSQIKLCIVIYVFVYM